MDALLRFFGLGSDDPVASSSPAAREGDASGGQGPEGEGDQSQASEAPHVLNLGDTASIKRVLDDSLVEEVMERGVEEDIAWSNVKIAGGLLAIAVALLAQFWPAKFPDNREVLLACLAAYVAINTGLYLLLVYVEGDTILFTRSGGPGGVGMAISTRMERFGTEFELEVAPLSGRWRTAAKQTKTAKYAVTRWFDEDGFLDEKRFFSDVDKVLPEGLHAKDDADQDADQDSKKSK
jgi:signal peptidase complex subunit 2